MIDVRGLHFAYTGGPPVLAGLDFHAEPGEIVLLTGASGSGKSTLLRALTGLVPHHHGGRISGRIRVGGADPIAEGPRGLAGAVGYVFQEPEAQFVFDTVARDVAFGPRAAGWAHSAVTGAVREACHLTGIAALRHRELATLSGGERQRAAIAGALATSPRVLLLDEPVSQLDATGVEQLQETLARLAAQGITVVIAEHRIASLAALRARQVAIGPEHPAPMPVRSPERDAGQGAALEVSGLRVGYHDRQIGGELSTTLLPGEVMVLDGPNGSGKSTLLRTLAGHVPELSGHVALGGHALRGRADARFPRVMHLSQDAARWMLTETVAAEIEYGMRRLGLDARERQRRLDELSDRLALTEHLERHPNDLSVGQRQLTAIAAALAVDPSLLLLDEPTRGLDQTRVRLLLTTLERRVAAGMVLVVATHDRQFAARLADLRLATRR